MALFEVVAQIINEFICNHIFKAHDVGRSMYVHLFGAVFGLGVSKAINFNNVPAAAKQTSVYHSDLFAFIGTLFLWVFFPSFNAIFAENEGQTKAIINTYLALTASTIVTIGMSSLMGNGRINAVSSLQYTISSLKITTNSSFFF
jgi:ammonium transporter Rh